MTDYTTKTVVKGELGITDTDDDTTIDQIITAVSAWIDAYCGRTFGVPPGSGSIRTYTAVPDGSRVYIDGAIEIIEITTDDGTRTYDTSVDVGDYEGAPYNAIADGKGYTHILPLNGYRFPTGNGAVRVEARFGVAAIPAPIVRACILQTQRLYKRKDAPFGVVGSTSAEMGQLMVIPKLDPDVKLMLSAYRSVWVV